MIENNRLYCDVCHGSLVDVKWEKTAAGKIICGECLGVPAAASATATEKAVGRWGVWILLAVIATFGTIFAAGAASNNWIPAEIAALVGITALVLWAYVIVGPFLEWSAPGWAKAVIVILIVIAGGVLAAAIALNSEWHFWGVAVPIR